MIKIPNSQDFCGKFRKMKGGKAIIYFKTIYKSQSFIVGKEWLSLSRDSSFLFLACFFYVLSKTEGKKIIVWVRQGAGLRGSRSRRMYASGRRKMGELIPSGAIFSRDGDLIWVAINYRRLHIFICCD